jgi:D-alanyl-D-alanine carboxypeptidase/D-alanyl-D-alanine-endopeptidase (penicillin-binding protein 4)
MIKLLHYMHADKLRFEAFRGSLAAPGRPGTLSKRFLGCPLRKDIRAKTGTLSGVSSLAGYLVSEQGHTIAFSIFTNDIEQTYKAKHFEDNIVQAIVRLE